MNTEELKRLLEKYYEGSATEEEEALLVEFFSNDNIPEGYEAEKAIFSYFKLNKASDDLEDRIMAQIGKAEENKKRKYISPRIISYLSIAAGVLIIISLWFFSDRKKYSEDTFSDPRLAYAETMKILASISARMSSTEEALAPVAKMNEATIRGFRQIGETTSIVENNLKSLQYMQKAIDFTKTAEENK